MITSANASTSVADPGADLALLHAALAAQKDDYLHLAADFDNFRKRTQRDSERQAAVEKEAFIRELLPVLDDLERALSREQLGSFEQMYEGVAMTLHRLAQLIHRQGIEAVEDLGRPFDPHRHEAVSLGHDPRQADDVILKVIQRGYCRGDKVFRPAKVIVNSPGRSFGGGRGR